MKNVKKTGFLKPNISLNLDFFYDFCVSSCLSIFTHSQAKKRTYTSAVADIEIVARRHGKLETFTVPQLKEFCNEKRIRLDKAAQKKADLMNAIRTVYRD